MTKAKNSIQLAIYCLYLSNSKDETIKGIPASAELYFLRNLVDSEKELDPITSHNFNDIELSQTKELIIETAKNIRNNYFKPKKGFHCDWCDYKHLLCPEWTTEV